MSGITYVHYSTNIKRVTLEESSMKLCGNARYS